MFDSTVKKVILLHGWLNRRPKDHWMRLTATELRAAGHQVWYPQFPNPEEPETEEWQNLLEAEVALMDEVPGGEKIAVAHSLGCINWLVGARSNRLGERFDRVVFVAPPDPDLLNEIEGAKLDLTDPEWRAAILRTTERFSIVSSENDRWIPRGIDETYTQTLGFTPVIVPGGLHFSIDDGWGKWQGMFEWLAGNGADDSLFAKR